ncbi:DAK2 domain-containing protein [Streptomyces clavuligerus]|uniref:Putative dihydroxyacetone kinase n=1 Tax=Streptomyces clavuligerus TaxID=1901 RepID=E2Q8X1_STRCL|nr:DAK2 domain-containing protein [Streptomyces clavuligerus]ANW17867.1 dihydroxyacetone kinase [Streptomyces clavuligerus]AXU12419.1 DAK2 domain-containing protein [Streptomyces clavuligerus]EFG09585.1 Putative dihydroxyacetone kinase [Streptomyces clavuligerus]MBY6302308.1 DAK2 domain-containing protein [Streptomyces clavuligerus]QCS05201.1 DAK2 domain-containing protein [Streptomyces clavuligerus]
MPQTPQNLDAAAVRTWCAKALATLGRERADIDAINVYPVADGDTGTNLYLTVESAAQAVEAVFAAHGTRAHEPGTAAYEPDVADTVRAMAHGALIGARGNSGTILAQLLRGVAERVGAGDHLPGALRRAAVLARDAVAHPVEGTILTVAGAAADAAGAVEPPEDTVRAARAAYEGARAALDATPGQLAVLGRAGVVDAGGRGLLAVLGALVAAVSGQEPAPGPVRHTGVPVPRAACADGGPAFEVIYLLEADDTAVARLRSRLDALGDSLVVVGGDGLWNVHVHVDDAGAAIEAGVEAGRPHRIRVTHFGTGGAPAPDPLPRPREEGRRAVVVVVPGEGLAELCAGAGARAVVARPGEPPASGELADAIRRAHAPEVVLLPNAAELRHTASAAADQARAEGIRVAIVPTRAAVQGLAALAVHEPDRRFDEDVVAMTAAAGATRCAELTVAERQSWTSAGVCQAGDVLGLIDGDVAVIGGDPTEVALAVLDRMLAAGGELVTLVLGDAAPAPAPAPERLERHVRDTHLAVDTVTYHAGRGSPLLLIGVE